MGGYGSGRPGRKQKAEDCRALDVNKLRRDGCLVEGWRGNLHWSRNGETKPSIAFNAEQRCVALDYRVRVRGGDWEQISQRIGLTYASCNYGGQRPYFLCPGVVDGHHCGRRVGKLFSGGRYFLCRHCYSIGYTSQSETRHDRLLRRANHFRTKLGGLSGTANPIAEKPKGMWWRTYLRKCSEIERMEHQANIAFLNWFRQTHDLPGLDDGLLDWPEASS